eukprot:4292323-Amphidinium_carterae.1
MGDETANGLTQEEAAAFERDGCGEFAGGSDRLFFRSCFGLMLSRKASDLKWLESPEGFLVLPSVLTPECVAELLELLHKASSDAHSNIDDATTTGAPVRAHIT